MQIEQDGKRFSIQKIQGSPCALVCELIPDNDSPNGWWKLDGQLIPKAELATRFPTATLATI